MIRYWWSFVLAGWLLGALVAQWRFADVNQVVLARMFATPQPDLWLGADDLGRAIAPRVIAGAAISFPVALLVVAISLSVGTAFGVSCAWCGGIWDRLGMHVMDIVLAFPGILLAIALAALLGAGLDNVVIALCAVGWVGFARLARAQTLSLKHRDHVQAARALGVPAVTLLIRHVLQLQFGALLVEAIFAFAGAIAAEAGLSFLGLGAQAPTPSWGNMLREAAQYLLIAPHMLLGPGIAMVSLVLAILACGEHLRARWSNE